MCNYMLVASLAGVSGVQSCQIVSQSQQKPLGRNGFQPGSRVLLVCNVDMSLEILAVHASFGANEVSCKCMHASVQHVHLKSNPLRTKFLMYKTYTHSSVNHPLLSVHFTHQSSGLFLGSWNRDSHHSHCIENLHLIEPFSSITKTGVIGVKGRH